MLSLFVMCLMVLVASSCTPNKRTKTLHATLVAVNAARDGFTAWDREHQASLARTLPSREAIDQALDAYHAKRRPVVDSFEVAYRALAVAATQTDDMSLKTALDGARELLTALQKLVGR